MRAISISLLAIALAFAGSLLVSQLKPEQLIPEQLDKQPLSEKSEAVRDTGISTAVAATSTAEAEPPTPPPLADNPLRAMLSSENPQLSTKQLDALEGWYQAWFSQHVIQTRSHELVALPSAAGFDCGATIERGSASALEDLGGCVPYFTNPTHPYLSYPTESLIALSEGDPVASAVLASRATDEDTAFTFALRAAALSGKAGPLLRLLPFAGGALDAQGLESKDALAKRFVLTSLGQRLGLQSARPDPLLENLSQRFTPEELAQVQERIRKLERLMNDLRLENGLEGLPGEVSP